MSLKSSINTKFKNEDFASSNSAFFPLQSSKLKGDQQWLFFVYKIGGQTSGLIPSHNLFQERSHKYTMHKILMIRQRQVTATLLTCASIQYI